MSEKLSNNTRSKKRVIHIDTIKIIAVVMVLYVHRDTFTLAYASCDYGIKTLILQAFSIVFYCGVPLFFMTSGALLLGKDEDYSYVIRHRLSRMLIVMLLITAAVSIARLHGGQTVTAGTFSDVFFKELNWFFYAYVGYIIMLPVLRRLADNADLREARLFIALVILLNAISAITIAWDLYSPIYDYSLVLNSNLIWISGGAFYPVIGYFLEKYDNIADRKIICLAAAVSVIAGVIAVIGAIKRGLSYELINNIRHHMQIAPCVLIYSETKKLCAASKFLNREKIKKAIVVFSGTTFGIFIIECQTPLTEYINGKLMPCADIIGRYWTGWVSIAVSLGVYFVITDVAKDIPYLKKLL